MRFRKGSIAVDDHGDPTGTAAVITDGQGEPVDTRASPGESEAQKVSAMTGDGATTTLTKSPRIAGNIVIFGGPTMVRLISASPFSTGTDDRGGDEVYISLGNFTPSGTCPSGGSSPFPADCPQAVSRQASSLSMSWGNIPAEDLMPLPSLSLSCRRSS